MRPFFPVLEQAKEYVLDEIHSVRAFRLTALLQVTGGSRRSNPVEVVIDTGAPFSVLPYGVWARRDVEFILPPGRSLRPVIHGAPGLEAPSEMTWLGVRCTMGQARVCLVDEQGLRSLPFTLLAKLPVGPVRGLV